MKEKISILMVMLLSLALILSACSPSTPAQPQDNSPEVEAPDQTETEMDTETKIENQDMSEDTGDTMDAEGEDSSEAMDTEEALPDMTLDELSTYTGKDGQPAYVAVDGIVYDVSHLDKWKTGQHMGQHDAGQDLSEEILQSPHGKKILERAIPVANLIE